MDIFERIRKEADEKRAAKEAEKKKDDEFWERVKNRQFNNQLTGAKQ